MFLNLTAVVPVSSRLFSGPEQCHKQEIERERGREGVRETCFFFMVCKWTEEWSSSEFLSCSPVENVQTSLIQDEFTLKDMQLQMVLTPVFRKYILN